MLSASLPENEPHRLVALHALNILDSSPDVRFDCITSFATEKLDVPICLITFIDAERQWFKSMCGIDATEVHRDISICAHAICEITNNHPRGRIFEVSDTLDDSRFFDNPQVVNKPWVRSYIGFVLQTDSGMNVGTFCLVDKRPRKFDDDEIDLIIELGSMAEDLVNGHYSNKASND